MSYLDLESDRLLLHGDVESGSAAHRPAEGRMVTYSRRRKYRTCRPLAYLGLVAGAEKVGALPRRPAAPWRGAHPRRTGFPPPGRTAPRGNIPPARPRQGTRAILRHAGVLSIMWGPKLYLAEGTSAGAIFRNRAPTGGAAGAGRPGRVSSGRTTPGYVGLIRCCLPGWAGLDLGAQRGGVAGAIDCSS